RRHACVPDHGDRHRGGRAPGALYKSRAGARAGGGVKLVVLAAGYATRLYPLTRDRPKHLLEVAGRPVLDHALESLEPIGFDGAFVVTNGKFAEQFREWAAQYRGEVRPEIVDDGTTSEEDRLGAIGDLGLVLREAAVDDDLVVAAGDNLFTETLAGFGD